MGSALAESGVDRKELFIATKISRQQDFGERETRALVDQYFKRYPFPHWDSNFEGTWSGWQTTTGVTCRRGDALLPYGEVGTNWHNSHLAWDFTWDMCEQ